MKKLLLIIVLGLLTSNLFAQQIPICLIDSGSNPYRQMNGCKWFNAPIGVLSDPLTNFLVGGKVRTFVGQNFQYGVSLVLLVDSNFSFQAGNIDGRFGSGTTIKLSDTKQKIVLTTGIGSGLWLGEDFGKTVLGDYGGIGGHGTNVYVRDSVLYRDVTINSGGATTLFNASGIKNSVLTTANGLVKIDGTGQFATTAATTSTGINLVTVPNPGITAFIRLNSDNSVSTRTSSQMVSDLGLGSMAKADSTGFFHKSDTVITVVTKNYAATTFPNVTKSGENYLSLTGQAITANAVNLATSNVTGVLPVANGGFDPNNVPFIGNAPTSNSIDMSTGDITSNTGGAHIFNNLYAQFSSQVFFTGCYVNLDGGSGDAGLWNSGDQQIAVFNDGTGIFNYAHGGLKIDGSGILTSSFYTSNGGIAAFDGSGNMYQLGTDGHSAYTLHADNSFRAINYATDGSGILAPANGGTGINNGSNTLILGGSLATTGSATQTIAMPTSASTYIFPDTTSQVLGTITKRLTGQTAAKTVHVHGVGSADASFEVSANILVTTATLHTFTATVTYTDEGNTLRTLTLQFSTLAGAFITAMTNAQGAVPYEGVPLHIRCKASTNITVSTTGTFTTCVYNFESSITRIN